MKFNFVLPWFFFFFISFSSSFLGQTMRWVSCLGCWIKKSKNNNNKRNSIEQWMFKFGSTIKVKHSSLAWTRTKPINNVWEISLESLKTWTWLDSLVKLSSSSMSTANLSSLSCFWARDLINIHYRLSFKPVWTSNLNS